MAALDIGNAGTRARELLGRARAEGHRQVIRARREWTWKGFFHWFAIAFFSGLALLVFLILTLDWNQMRGAVGRFVSARVGREVRIEGKLDVHLLSWTPWATAERVTVGNPSWIADKKLGRVEKIVIKVRLVPLLFGNVEFPFIQVDRPDVALVRDGAGRANWDFSGESATDLPAFRLPPINTFIVSDGHVTLNDARQRLTFDGSFSSREEIGGKTENRFVLDGKGTMRGLPLTASVRGGPLIRVDPDKPYGLTADIRHGSTHVIADGALARPFDLGHFTAKTRLSGPSMADLYFLTGLALPSTSAYRLSGTFIRDGRFYRFTKFGGTVGRSDLFGEVSVDTSSGRPFVRANLASKSLALSDLGTLIGSTPNGAAVRVKTAGGETKTVVTSARVLPDMPLRVDRVRGMDAVVDYKGEHVRSADLPLRQFTMHMTLDHGVMRFDPVAFTFPQGKLAAKVKIDARGRVPVSDVDARLTNVQLAQFFGAHPVVSGALEARAKLHGAGDSMHRAAATANGTLVLVMPQGAVRKAYAELSGINITPGLFELLGNDKSETPVRCGLASFEANNGSLISQRLVIDTSAIQIRGHGTVNLATERMSFTVQGNAKSFKLIRLRSPIVIGGTLADPSVGIQASGAVAQGGIALALGAFLSPLAAILPFVDPGLAKNANCAALLTEAQSQGAPVKAKAIRNAPRE